MINESYCHINKIITLYNYRRIIIFGLLTIITGNAINAQGNLNWVKVTDQAGWQPRDSQGELVFKNRLWILGGWFNSYKPCPRDVWSTGDGKEWKLVQKEAAWKHSDLSMSVVFKDKMWLMGGWYNGRLPNHSSSNHVWCSDDGVMWEQVTSNAGWSPRVAAGIVVFKGKLWILGGIEDYYFGDEKSLKNDVWYSSDGKEWIQATDSAGWSPRAYHQVVVFNDKIWVFGGGNYVPNHTAFNDVWSSDDGINWLKVTSSAAWAPRLWFSSVVYHNRIFVLGGWSKSHDNFGDVWYSEDGSKWTELKSNVIWKARHEHSTFVFQDKIWVAGGLVRPHLSNEVWSLEIPNNWFEDE